MRVTRVEALLALQQTAAARLAETGQSLERPTMPEAPDHQGETTAESDVLGDRRQPGVLALAHARDRILRIAASMASDADRMRFLDDVPDHRRTLELASQLLGSPSSIEAVR